MEDEDGVLAHLRDAIEVAARGSFGTIDDLRWRVEDQVRDEYRDEPEARRAEVVQQFLAELDVALAEQRADEAKWTSPTVNDRITAAFAELTGSGVIALENAGYTMSDGWTDVEEARRQHAGAWGAVFYHGQDLTRAVQGGGLYLAFGAFVGGENTEQDSLRLGKLVVEVLARHDVPAEWNGTTKSRIHIPEFEWQRRRSD